jgi:biopolymer transport protein ExbD
MRFHVRKRSNTPTVIIVALVDVLVVLLIFLMVTTSFKQQPTLRLALPESSQTRKSGASTNEPPFVVSITSNAVIFLDKTPIPFDTLRARLQAEVAKNPQVKLAINADRYAPFYRIVNVMDIARDLKIKSVSAATTAAKDAEKP